MLGSSKMSSNINQPAVQYDQGINPPAAGSVNKALVSTPSLNLQSEPPSFLSQPTLLNGGLNGGGPRESNSVIKED